MKSKVDLRKQLEAGMSIFFSQGKVVTKIPSQKKRIPKSEPKEEAVEIEVEHLPPTLRAKFFAE